MIEMSISEAGSVGSEHTCSSRITGITVFRHPLVSAACSKARKWFDRTQGYHFGITTCAVASGAVCFANSVFALWAAIKFDVSGGFGTIQQGDCKESQSIALWLHLAINTLSTLVLGASNYAMQCLSSPTREEIDRAHGKHIWLDIGVPSVRNLTKISRARMIWWVIIAFTSLPLQLLYNSAIFTTLSVRTYSVFVVTQDFFTNSVAPDDEFLRDMRTNHTWETLSNSDCIKAYNSEFVSNRATVLLVVARSSDGNPTILLEQSDQRPQIDAKTDPRAHQYNWMCGDNQEECDPSKVNSTQWKVGGYLIDHCASQVVDEHCTVLFSLPIMITVIICSGVKMLVMSHIASGPLREPVATLGDAISSFLDDPDPTTLGTCLFSKNDFVDCKYWHCGPKTWQPQTYFWYQCTGGRRWIASNACFLFTIPAAGLLLKPGLGNPGVPNKSISYLWSEGFGAITPDALMKINVPGSTGLIATTLLANSAQVLLSFLYLTYNSHFTRMWMGVEWSEYAHRRKSLRVSSPRGQQRSTYFLQLPYRYGIPLLLTSGVLHWLVSQSIFIARISVLDGSDTEVDSASTCGYSDIALICTIVVGFTAVMVGVLVGFRKCKPGLPLAGSCSAVISAACHSPAADTKASEKLINWGALKDKPVSSDDDDDTDKINDKDDNIDDRDDEDEDENNNGSEEGEGGHCCFTSFHVTYPEDGGQYS